MPLKEINQTPLGYKQGAAKFKEINGTFGPVLAQAVRRDSVEVLSLPQCQRTITATDSLGSDWLAGSVDYALLFWAAQLGIKPHLLAKA